MTDSKMIDLMQLIPKLILLRESTNLSQREVGRRMNRSQTYVTRLEAEMSSRKMTLEVLQEYLKALGYSFEIVIRDKDFLEVMRVWR